ncbi:MAG TPA: condensation domain-containing protein [Asanoa sp.]|nr:condensation domain-containing protein [Asanoa sp.]
MADLRSRIAALSPDQRARLEARIAERATGAHPPDRIGPRDRTAPTPLGIAQQREWAVSRVRGANNVPSAFRVEGEVDFAVLGQVLTELLERQEVLRSTVEAGADGAPVQVVGPVGPVPIPVVDLTGLAPDAQRERVRQICLAGTVRPFEPHEVQRLRVTVIRLAPDDHVCFIVTDHAASDAWSLAILVQEIVSLYAWHRHGRDARPARPEIQFGDFAAWQRQRCGPEQQAAEVRHWRQTLAGMPTSMELPTDREQPARPTYTGETYAVELPASLVAAVRAFSERENASLFPILFAASTVLLYRHVDQGDIVLGSLVSGRTRVETERLIGCFANPLPLRMRVYDDQTLLDVVKQARDTLATALDHQDVPFDRVVEELGLARESAHTSLSRMWINVITMPAISLELPGLRFDVTPIDLGVASVDLTLTAFPEEGRLRLEWQYMTELFDPETVTLLADQFAAVLRQVVTTPDRIVGDVEFDVGESADEPAPDGVVEAFRRRVAESPYAPAVVGDRGVTTYAELATGLDPDGPLAALTAGGADLLAAARATVDRLGLGAGDRLRAGPPLPAVETLATWLAGGAVDTRTDLAGVTVLDLTTAAWRAWAAGLDGPLPDSLRLVVVTGVQPRPEELARWRERHAVPVRLSPPDSGRADGDG